MLMLASIICLTSIRQEASCLMLARPLLLDPLKQSGWSFMTAKHQVTKITGIVRQLSRNSNDFIPIKLVATFNSLEKLCARPV